MVQPLFFRKKKMPVYITKDNPEKERLVRKAFSFWRPSIDVEKIIFLPGGSNSIVVRAGDFVCRFPQTETAFMAMRREAVVTEILKQNFPLFSETTEVSVVEQTEDDFPEFSCHRYIPGRIIDNRRGETEFNMPYNHLTARQKKRLAERTAAFLAGLHSIPTELFQDLPPLSNEQNWDFTGRVNVRLSRELLLKATNGRVDLKEFETECSQNAVFCHNDLSGSNLLVDLNKKDVLAGVIDFGDAGVFPQTNEFIPLYKIGRDFVCQTVEEYNKISPIPVDMREIDYKFLCFIGFFLEQQKKPSFFTTALIQDFVQSLSYTHLM